MANNVSGKEIYKVDENIETVEEILISNGQSQVDTDFLSDDNIGRERSYSFTV